MRVALISLGCSKNLVNSEQMMFLLQQAGYELCPNVDHAEAVVVNTCGFLESARAEAVETIIELGLKKPLGILKTILVAGCMAQRHRDEILTEMHEVDGVVGCGSYDMIVEALDKAVKGERPAYFDSIDAPVTETARVLGTPNFFAYLKVAEGCDNHCAYCCIPSLRGKFRSRSMESLVKEAETLVAQGVRELILVAQDTTRYGLDLYGERVLPQLINKLCAIPALHWLRLHYLYPHEVTDELLDTMAAQPKCVHYLDIPIQHCNDAILQSMGRRGTRAQLETLVERIRAKMPDAVLRTSVIVGLPGETEEAFEELCDFLRRTRWERAGVFEYSPEEGTPAAVMSHQVEEDVKSHRREIVEALQSDVMDDFNEGYLEETLEILCEGYDKVAECYYGRSVFDAPEVDGKVFFSAPKGKVTAGEFVNVLITETVDGDMWGEMQ